MTVPLARFRDEEKCQLKDDRTPIGADCRSIDFTGAQAFALARAMDELAQCSSGGLAALDSCAGTLAPEQACIRQLAEFNADRLYTAIYRPTEPVPTPTATVAPPTATPNARCAHPDADHTAPHAHDANRKETSRAPYRERDNTARDRPRPPPRRRRRQTAPNGDADGTATATWSHRRGDLDRGMTLGPHSPATPTASV